jgi:hypothetical protein
MSFMTPPPRDLQWTMTVLETRSEDKRTRSEIIERAPFTCDCRKPKFLKGVSHFLYFVFWLSPMPAEIESADVSMG